MKRKWTSYLIPVAIPLAVGGLSSLLTRRGMEEFQTHAFQPPLSPPEWVFPVVWTILYVLMGVASYLVFSSSAPLEERRRALGLYAVQLAVNFFWSIIFFNLEWYLFSFLWLILLWVLVLATYLAFHRINRTAGALLLPYLVWLTFAAYLSFGVYLLN